MKKNIFSSTYSSVSAAVLTAILGLILLIWPSLSNAVICYGLSAGVLVYGVYRICMHFRYKPQSVLQKHDLAAGIMLIAIALFILIDPEFIISLLPVLLGLLLIMGGARETQIAIDLFRLRESRWFLPLIAAFVQVILGLIILWNPFATAMVLTRFIGIAVLIESISQIVFTTVLSRRE
ncbi:MAG TPA: DUF308 domain-containing protein [Candidatus Limiplasma sp.]|nr:DUF308 domain-containing protein [Candidatus Limiplasma sp.]